MRELPIAVPIPIPMELSPGASEIQRQDYLQLVNTCLELNCERLDDDKQMMDIHRDQRTKDLRFCLSMISVGQHLESRPRNGFERLFAAEDPRSTQDRLSIKNLTKEGANDFFRNYMASRRKARLWLMQYLADSESIYLIQQRLENAINDRQKAYVGSLSPPANPTDTNKESHDPGGCHKAARLGRNSVIDMLDSEADTLRLQLIDAIRRCGGSDVAELLEEGGESYSIHSHKSIRRRLRASNAPGADIALYVLDDYDFICKEIQSRTKKDYHVGFGSATAARSVPGLAVGEVSGRHLTRCHAAHGHLCHRNVITTRQTGSSEE
ncbi:MAG: hypothetical protein ACYCUI_16420 [Vulcanimicrobiaceae bacterium]